MLNMETETVIENNVWAPKEHYTRSFKAPLGTKILARFAYFTYKQLHSNICHQNYLVSKIFSLQ